MNKLIVLFLMLVISGCKFEISVPTKLSAIHKGEGETTAEILVEVTSCNSYEDSRKPSRVLQDIKAAVIEHIKGINYEDCFRRKMYSFARFSIPVKYVLNAGKEKMLTPIEINYIDDGDSERTIYLDLAAETREQINNLQNSQHGIEFDYDITVTIFNDLDTDTQMRLMYVYAGGNHQPVTFNEVTIPKGKDLPITLSNVAADALLNISNSTSAIVGYEITEADIK